MRLRGRARFIRARIIRPVGAQLQQIEGKVSIALGAALVHDGRVRPDLAVAGELVESWPHASEPAHEFRSRARRSWRRPLACAGIRSGSVTRAAPSVSTRGTARQRPGSIACTHRRRRGPVRRAESHLGGHQVRRRKMPHHTARFPKVARVRRSSLPKQLGPQELL